MTSRTAPARPSDPAGWRQRNGISLSAIAEATKISVRYLEAIERGTFHTLPGGAYGLSYIRQYAQAIHYDADELIEQYRLATAEPTSQPTSEPAPPPVVTWMHRIWQHVHSLL